MSDMEPKLSVEHLKHCQKHKICGRCPKCRNERRRQLYAARKDDPERKRRALQWRVKLRGNMRRWRTIYNSKLKREAFEAYGGAHCACGESELDRLALDHVENNGHTDRAKTRRSGVKLYSFLKTSGWPAGFQVLCHNCNILKRAARYEAKCVTRRQRTALATARKLKLRVVAHYGNGKAACVRCGYDRLEALTIDHVNDDGHLTRGQISPGRVAYLKLIRDSFPSGYQTLCFCCNMEKEILLRR